MEVLFVRLFISFVQSFIRSPIPRLLTSDALALQSEAKWTPYFTSRHVHKADVNRQQGPSGYLPRAWKFHTEGWRRIEWVAELINEYAMRVVY